MTRVFLPGCKVKAKYPVASERLAKAVIDRGYADEVLGCCRVEHQKLKPEDTAVCICVNCMAMVDEDAANRETVNVWQLIDADPDFPLPDHSGLTVSVQDCGRSYDRGDLHDAIRSLLAKMNVRVVEAPDAREKTTYCGAAGMKAIPEMDAGFAPQRYTQDAPTRGMFVPCDEDEIPARLKSHADEIPADDVVCYCTACHAGLEQGGKRAVNLIELVFGN